MIDNMWNIFLPANDDVSGKFKIHCQHAKTLRLRALSTSPLWAVKKGVQTDFPTHATATSKSNIVEI